MSKKLIHLAHRLLLHCRKNVRIQICCHVKATMPQNFLYDLHRHTHTQQECCRTMSQVVKADMRQSRLFKQAGKLTSQSHWLKKFPTLSTEHQIATYPSSPDF